MLYIILILVGLILVGCPGIRCFVFHLPQSLYYFCRDTFSYFYHQKWKEWRDCYSGITCFVGMFGRGKTLSMTKTAVDIYNYYARFGKRVRIVSNYDIKSVPYIPLVNFEQIVELGNLAVQGLDDCVGTIVCIDEIEMLFSHRKFATFPVEVLSSICQSRKAHIMLLTSAQRWKMQDAAIRDITYWCVDCNKIWRIQRQNYYDAWEVENATNVDMVRAKKRKAWFVFDKYYRSYDTTKLISKEDMQNFISNDELLQRRYANSLTDNEAIVHPSRRLKNRRKQQSKK